MLGEDLSRKKKSKFKNNMAKKIQCVFRKYKAISETSCLRMELAQEKRIKFFNYCAKRIQQAWRGYDCRLHIFNFYKQKEYLSAIHERNVQMRFEMENYQAQTFDQLRREKYERQAQKQEQQALHQHHLVSTSAMPSSFHPPSSRNASNDLPPIEQFIRNVNKAKLCVPNIPK